MKVPQFEMKHFFNMGRVVFTIVLMCNLFNLLFFWDKSFITAKVIGIAMAGFYVALVLMFNMQYKSARIAPAPLSEEGLDSIIEKIK